MSKAERLIIVILILVTGFVILRNAWVCDDAYISFRTVDNFVSGYGLTWNSDERVQAFTNPLWVFLMSAAYALTGDVYYTSIFLSLLLTLAALLILCLGIARSSAAAALGVVILLFSKAFIDYSTSGLENALTHLILVSFYYVYFAREHSKRSLLVLSFIAALGTLNRMDTVLLFIPALTHVLINTRRLNGLLTIGIGFLPFILWELFAILYYGFPFPNTFYAKLHTGIPVGELWSQGFFYFLDTLHIDPLTLMVIAASFVAVPLMGGRRDAAVLIGIAVYLLYVLRIGGDFMSGRFFTAPLVCATIILSRLAVAKTWTGRLIPVGAVILVGLVSPRSPLFNDKTYGRKGEAGINERGIADERAWYYQSTGLLLAKRDQDMPDHKWITRGRTLRLKKQPIHTESVVGFVGFAAGPDVHIVDGYGLTEPLLARLPMKYTREWRIGHFSRVRPFGYIKSVTADTNVIADSGVAAFYDTLRLITQGRLLEPKRLKAIWKMNVGHYDHLLAAYTSREPDSVQYTEISHRKPQGTAWNADGTFEIRYGGLHIRLDSVVHNREIEMSFDHNDYYAVILFRDTAEVGYQTVKKKIIPHGGLRVDTLAISATAIDIGFNKIVVYPDQGDDLYSVGHVILLPDSQ